MILLKDNLILGTTTTTTSVSTTAQTQQENVLAILFISFLLYKSKLDIKH